MNDIKNKLSNQSLKLVGEFDDFEFDKPLFKLPGHHTPSVWTLKVL